MPTVLVPAVAAASGGILGSGVIIPAAIGGGLVWGVGKAYQHFTSDNEKDEKKGFKEEILKDVNTLLDQKLERYGEKLEKTFDQMIKRYDAESNKKLEKLQTQAEKTQSQLGQLIGVLTAQQAKQQAPQQSTPVQQAAPQNTQQKSTPVQQAAPQNAPQKA